MRDPYRRVDILESSRPVRVEVDGTVVAATHRPRLVLETSMPAQWYIPRTDINWAYLSDSAMQSYCQYKGKARYWDVTIDAQGTFGKAFLAAIAKGQFRYTGNGETYFPLTGVTDAQGSLREYDVVLKAISEWRIVTVRGLLSHILGFYDQMAEACHSLSELMPRGSLAIRTAFFHNDGWQDDNIDAEMGYVLGRAVDIGTIEIRNPDVQIHTLPAVETMATIIRMGHTAN